MGRSAWSLSRRSAGRCVRHCPLGPERGRTQVTLSPAAGFVARARAPGRRVPTALRPPGTGRVCGASLSESHDRVGVRAPRQPMARNGRRGITGTSRGSTRVCPFRVAQGSVGRAVPPVTVGEHGASRPRGPISGRKAGRPFVTWGDALLPNIKACTVRAAGDVSRNTRSLSGVAGWLPW